MSLHDLNSNKELVRPDEIYFMKFSKTAERIFPHLNLQLNSSYVVQENCHLEIPDLKAYFPNTYCRRMMTTSSKPMELETHIQLKILIC